MKQIGLFIDAMYNLFHVNVVSGMMDASQAHNVSLSCFEYSVLRSNSDRITPDDFSSIISGKDIDALIITPGTLEPFFCREQFYSFFKQTFSIPILFIMSQPRKFPVIRINNEGGMKNLLFHLFSVHGFRRPAFLMGIRKNSDFNIRLEVFRSVCSDYGIPVEETYICEGTYNFDSGREAVRKLYGNEKPKCDVIVAANDELAAGAMFELQSRGISVPDDVAITGFDGTDRAKFTSPPLTTVKQPLYAMGTKAVEYICELLKGNAIPEETIIPTELIIRGSCGCPKNGSPKIGSKDSGYSDSNPGSIPENESKNGNQEKTGPDGEDVSIKPYIISYERKNLINYNDEEMDTIMKYLGRNYADPELSISRIGTSIGIPSIKIAKIIKKRLNLNFKKLLNSIRCAEAKRLLEKTDRYITDIAFHVGYNSRSHFYKAFFQAEGVSPLDYRRRFLE